MSRKPWDHASCAGHIPAREYGTTKRLCIASPEDEAPTRQLAALCASIMDERPKYPEPKPTRKAIALVREMAGRVEYPPTRRSDGSVTHECPYTPEGYRIMREYLTWTFPKNRDYSAGSAGYRCPACAWEYPERPQLYVDGSWCAVDLIGPYPEELGAARPTVPAEAYVNAEQAEVRPLAALLAEHRARKGTPVAPVRAPMTRAPRARKEAPTMPESTPAAEPATDPAPATGSVKRPARLTCVCGKSYRSAGDETVGAIYHRTWTAKDGTYGPQLAHFVAALDE
jgi:hypothetical protein